MLGFSLGSSRELREEHRNGDISASVTFGKVAEWDEWECCTLDINFLSECKVKKV